MDADRFDGIAKRVSSGESRRRVVAGALAAAAAGWRGPVGTTRAAAKPCEGPRSNGQPCSGCCAEDGRCIANVDRTACGKNGSRCEFCTAGTWCNVRRGRCVCDSDSCFGCCTTDESGQADCVKGHKSAACGKAGLACVSCPEGQRCGRNRTCVQGACKPGQRRCTGSGGFSCCTPSQDCCDGFCCPTGEECGPEGRCRKKCGPNHHRCFGPEAFSCCDSNQDCCEGFCCPSGEECGPDGTCQRV